MTRTITALAIAVSLCPPPTAARWQASHNENKMDNTSRFILITSGDEAYPGQLIGAKKPDLYIRCEKGSVDLVVDAKVVLGNNTGELHRHAGRVRFDDGKPERITGGEATSGTALFLPNLRVLIKRMTKANRMLVEITPFHYGAAVSTFDVSGLSDWAAELARNCGVK